MWKTAVALLMALALAANVVPALIDVASGDGLGGPCSIEVTDPAFTTATSTQAMGTFMITNVTGDTPTELDVLWAVKVEVIDLLEKIVWTSVATTYPLMPHVILQSGQSVAVTFTATYAVPTAREVRAEVLVTAIGPNKKCAVTRSTSGSATVS